MKKTDQQLSLWNKRNKLTSLVDKKDGSYEQELNLFCSFLCESEESLDGMSNVIWLWDSLPIWSCEQSNKKKEFPEMEVRRMEFEGTEIEVVIRPGVYEKQCSETGKTIGKRRYPGKIEMMVEQAIIKMACESVQCQDDKGCPPVYSVSFSMKRLRSEMEKMDVSVRHDRLKEAIDVLSTTSITIREVNPDSSGKTRSRRENIFPSFVRNEYKNKSEKDQWRVSLNSIVTQGINDVTYRQYRVGKVKSLAPYGVYMVRQMLLTCHTLAKENPYRVTISELGEMISGLGSSRIPRRIEKIERELDKMQEQGILESYTVELEKEKERANSQGGGRLATIDATFTLVPSEATIFEVKRASKRQTEAERLLNLGRTKRGDRRVKSLEKALINKKDQS